MNDEQRIADWITAQIGGTVKRIDRQGRWRPAWHIDVEKNGVTLPLYARGERVENFLPYSLAREFQIWSLLEKGGVRVPHAYGFTENPPAIVMERVPGRPNLGTADNEADREAVRQQLAVQMVKMHRLDTAPFLGAGLRLPVDDRGLTLSQFDDIHARYLNDRRRPDPALAFAAAWVRRNAPGSTRPACFTACDAGQFLFEGGELTAMMDFELSVIGDPMMDLAALRIRSQWEDLGDIPSFYALYEQAGGYPIDLPAIRFHTVAFALAGAMASKLCMEQFLSAPQADANYVEYLVWIIWELKQALEAIGECMGVKLEQPELPPARVGWLDDPLFALTSAIAVQPEGDEVGTYRKQVQQSLAAYLHRVAGYGAHVEAAYLDDASAVLGERPATLADADRMLEHYVDGSDPVQAEVMLRLFHAHVSRQALMLAVPGSPYLNGLLHVLLPV